MNQESQQKAVNALLIEYKNVVIALKDTINTVTCHTLTTTVGVRTNDPDYQSIQTILTHIISSGYAYIGYIRKLKKSNDDRPGKMIRMTVDEFQLDLDRLVDYVYTTFLKIQDDELEEFDEDKKIITSWGQVYDIEQMMEHAIVHVLKNRRLIEKFRRKLESL